MILTLLELEPSATTAGTQGPRLQSPLFSLFWG